MPIYKRSFPVACRLEDAFEYVAEWSNLKDFMPFFVDLKPVSLVRYGPGTSLETTIVLGKLELATTLDLVEFVKNKKILYKATRGLRSKIGWEFNTLRDEVIVMFVFEYDVPPGLVLRDSQREALEKDIQEHANRSTELLKWALEAQRKSARG